VKISLTDEVRTSLKRSQLKSKTPNMKKDQFSFFFISLDTLKHLNELKEQEEETLIQEQYKYLIL